MTEPMLWEATKPPQKPVEPRSIHPNSRAASQQEKPLLQGRRAEIYDIVKRLGPITDRQIFNHTLYFDLNAVRPRITEMVKSGHLKEVGSTRCCVTDKMVRLVDIA